MQLYIDFIVEILYVEVPVLCQGGMSADTTAGASPPSARATLLLLPTTTTTTSHARTRPPSVPISIHSLCPQYMRILCMVNIRQHRSAPVTWMLDIDARIRSSELARSHDRPRRRLVGQCTDDDRVRCCSHEDCPDLLRRQSIELHVIRWCSFVATASGTLRWVPGYAHEGQAKAVRELLGNGRSMRTIHNKVRTICDTIFLGPASSVPQDLPFTPPSSLVASPQHIADCRPSMWGNGVAFDPTCVGRLLGFRAPRTVPSIHTGAGVPYVSAGGCMRTTPLGPLEAVSNRSILRAIRTSANRTFAPTLPLEHRLRISCRKQGTYQSFRPNG